MIKTERMEQTRYKGNETRDEKDKGKPKDDRKK